MASPSSIGRVRSLARNWKRFRPRNYHGARLMKSIARAATFAALVLTTPIALSAQGSPQFNIAAGFSFPTGDLGSFSDLGYNISGGLGMRQRGTPLGFRAEGMYNEWNVSGISN